MKMETDAIVRWIDKLVNIPSPSGFTATIIHQIEKEIQSLGFPMTKTNKGLLRVTVPGENEHVHRVVTAHVDTLGAMVKEMKANGRLVMSLIGGFRFHAIEGEYCTIHTMEGKAYTGTIVMHESSVHVYKDAGELPRDEQHMEIRIDEKVQTKEEVMKLGIQVGDFISFDPRFSYTNSGFIKSRHLDDKASVAILLSLLPVIKENGPLPYTTHFLISNNEEIGFGGNSSIPTETVEFLAVDMGAIGDGQATDEYTVSICAKDSSGPYHFGFRKQLTDLAKEHHIPYQVDIYPYYGSDASSAMRAGVDVKHALIGPGIDASHSYERTHVDSLQATAQLVYAYLYSPLIEE